MLNFSPSEGDFAHILRSRRTINDFREEQPPLETVLQAIEVARWAPNHKMTEPWRFHLLGPQSTERLIRINTELLTAEKGAEFAKKKEERWQLIPGWIIVTCQSSPDELRDEENYAAVSCAIQNLMLFLWSKEIGTKWATSAVLQDPRVIELLNIPSDTQRIVGLVWYGYPASYSETKRQSVPEITIVHP